MLPVVEGTDMVPSESSSSPRAAFARPGPGATPFPGVPATLQPSDSLSPSAAAPFPLATAYPEVEACS